MLRECFYNNKLHLICEYLNLTYCLMLPDNDNTRLLNKVKWPLWSIGDNKSSKIMGFVNIVWVVKPKNREEGELFAKKRGTKLTKCKYLYDKLYQTFNVWQINYKIVYWSLASLVLNWSHFQTDTNTFGYYR